MQGLQLCRGKPLTEVWRLAEPSEGLLQVHRLWTARRVRGGALLRVYVCLRCWAYCWSRASLLLKSCPGHAGVSRAAQKSRLKRDLVPAWLNQPLGARRLDDWRPATSEVLGAALLAKHAAALAVGGDTKVAVQGPRPGLCLNGILRSVGLGPAEEALSDDSD